MPLKRRDGCSEKIRRFDSGKFYFALSFDFVNSYPCRSLGNGFSILWPQMDSFSIYARSDVFTPSSLRSLRFKKGLLKKPPYF